MSLADRVEASARSRDGLPWRRASALTSKAVGRRPGSSGRSARRSSGSNAPESPGSSTWCTSFSPGSRSSGEAARAGRAAAEVPRGGGSSEEISSPPPACTCVTPTFCRLISDEPEKARRALRKAAERWSHQSFYLQHYFQLFGDAEISLYSGSGQGAWKELSERWWGLKQLARPAFAILSHRVAVTCARAAPCRLRRATTCPAPTAARFLRLAARDAQAYRGRKGAVGRPAGGAPARRSRFAFVDEREKRARTSGRGRGRLRRGEDGALRRRRAALPRAASSAARRGAPWSSRRTRGWGPSASRIPSG